MFTPLPYQCKAGRFTLDRLLAHKGAGLFLDPGLGKTATTLSVVDWLRMLGEIKKTLVIAPLRVVHNVWPQEIEKWGFGLSTSTVHGTPTQRAKALTVGADLYLTNPENVVWLQKQVEAKTAMCPDFDLVVVDESTKFKNWSAKRTKALRKMLKHIPKRVILTGTPSANSLKDLHAQAYILDDGEALGKTKTFFTNRYCRRGGFQGREWLLKSHAAKGIEEAIAPMVYRLKAEDYLDLPPIIYQDVYVDLPPFIEKVYKGLEKLLFAALGNGENLTASSAGAKYALCRGVANGGAYQKDDFGDRRAVHVHDSKVEAVEEIIEELNGKPVLVAYQFHHDRDRLLKAFPGAPVISGGTKPAATTEILEDWNAGSIPVLLCQPQAMAHGLNLQAGGRHVIWLGLTDSLETYDQLNRRLYRRGQTGPVTVHHILARGTIDEAIAKRLQDKDQSQRALLDALDKYRRGKE